MPDPAAAPPEGRDRGTEQVRSTGSDGPGLVSPSDERARRRTDRTRRAVEAATAVAREHGLRVEEPAILNDRFSVQVHLAPTPVVAGISTWTATIRPDITERLARKVAVTDHLEGAGAPVVGNSRELPPGPHLRDGLAMTFTAWAPPDPDRTPEAADCVAMLPDRLGPYAALPGDTTVLHGDLHPRVREPDQLMTAPPGSSARTASIVSASAAVLSGR